MVTCSNFFIHCKHWKVDPSGQKQVLQNIDAGFISGFLSKHQTEERNSKHTHILTVPAVKLDPCLV